LARTPYASHDRQFIPNPATYLNNRRWEDEAPSGAQDPYADWLARDDGAVIEGECRREANG
jgi:hypothetical protein